MIVLCALVAEFLPLLPVAGSSRAPIASWEELKSQAQSKQASAIQLVGPSFDSSDYDSAAAITASVSIDGNGAVLDASKGASSTTRRFFLMETGSPALSLRSLTLVNGYVVFSVYGGGAIYSSGGSINLTNCTFTGNTAHGAMGGGAIFSGGPVFVVDSVFVGNTAGACGGGAIYAGGNVSISGTSFVGNAAGYNAGALYALASAVTVTDSNFTQNTAQRGGALGLYSYGSAAAVVTLSNVTLRENAASSQGGAIFCGAGNELTLNNSALASNNASAGGGSAVYVDSGGNASVHCSTLNRSGVVGDASFSDACLPPKSYGGGQGGVRRAQARKGSVRVPS